MRILIIHGPNLNFLGKRESNIYGKESLDDLNFKIEDEGKKIGVETLTFQSNIEGELVEKIQESVGKIDGLIINPAAYTHTSIAIRDALLLLDCPIIEVHISNIYKREKFRQRSTISDIVNGKIVGLGSFGYIAALLALEKLIK